MMDLFTDADEQAKKRGEEPAARPPYVRPTMDDVRAVPFNGLVAVSTFSGCGGSSLGFRLAGFRVPYAVEFIPAAADTYEANSEAFVDRRDVRTIEAADVLGRLHIVDGELDVLEGSPPCASFSMAGKRESGWGEAKNYSDGVKQRTDDLFGEYARLLGDLRPRAFVAENVPGMTMGQALEEYAYRTTKMLGEHGYRVDGSILNAASFGVPQDRKRLIFIGFREDVGERPDVRETLAEKYRDPAAPRSLREALDDVPADDPDDVRGASMETFAVGRTWHAIRTAREAGRDEAAIGEVCQRCGDVLSAHREVRLTRKKGGKRNEASGHGSHVERATCADGGRAEIVKAYFMLTVPVLDAPCPTVTATGAMAGAASVTHPTECRKFTPAELKSICSFPADFRLTGTREQRSERMGRAVPPLMMRAVAGYVRDVLKGA